MIFLPKPLPDELLGSVLERGAYFNGLGLKDVFLRTTGVRKNNVSFFLPTAIARIAQCTSIDARELLWEHTMFPYVTAFLPKEQMRIAEEAALIGGSNATVLGSMIKAAFSKQTFRRYCSACAEMDIAQYGAPYWRRIHSLPGVSICFEHRMRLINSSLQPRISQEATAKFIPEGPEKPGNLHFPNSVETEIFKRSFEVLTRRIEPRQSWALEHGEAAKTQGYILANKRVSVQALCADIRATLGLEVLTRMNSCFVPTSQHAWPRHIIQNSLRVHSANRHIAFLAFLSLPKVLGEVRYVKPGPIERDYASLDRDLCSQILELNMQQPTWANAGLKSGLTRLGCWNIYRHNRKRLPMTTDALDSVEATLKPCFQKSVR